MGLVVLLVPGAAEQFSLGAAAASALAELGVTSVSVVRGADAAGLVVEGWAFDPGRAHEVAAAVGTTSATALTTVARMTVSVGAHEGGLAEERSTTPPAPGRFESPKQTIGKEE